MRIVFAGTPEVAVPSLRRLVASGHDVVGILTQPDGRARRGRGTVPTPVKAAAVELLGPDVPILQPESLRDSAAAEQIAALAPDVIPVVAYGNLVPRSALDVAPHGWINLHFSLLPRWRGAAPVQRAIEAGDPRTGAAVFQIEAGLDTGPVFATLETEIGPHHTASDLLTALSESGADLLARVIDGMAEGTARGVAQASDGITHAAKISPAEAQVDWTRPHEQVERGIRAVTAAPGAWTVWRGERFKVLALDATARPLGDPPLDLAPGQPALHDKALWVGTATTPLRVLTVAPAGKPAMDGAAWVRGARLEPSERFDYPAATETPTAEESHRA
ncbi:methionyl-tRNA formyltransferase [Micrococcales bacterium 31B]|nr:methionyl-tRNA formyltransferase [Micrococcales bacterium 31B]